MIYVALLRGINVGGNNKVSMKELTRTFGSLGFQNAIPYINSGNIVFTANTKDQGKIAQKIEKGIAKDFGFDIKVLIRDANNIQKLNKEIPTEWKYQADT